MMSTTSMMSEVLTSVYLLTVKSTQERRSNYDNKGEWKCMREHGS